MPQGPPNTIVTSPLAFSRSGSRDRDLELELMNRWSTRSWQILYAVPECRNSILNHFTRDSLSYQCMTKEILAVAALDTALHGGGSKSNSSSFYIQRCLDYMNEASVYRVEQMKHLNRYNHWILSEFDSIHGMILYALPKSHEGQPAMYNGRPNVNIIDRTITFWELSAASLEVCHKNMGWMLSSPSSASAILQKYPIDLTLLDTIPRVKAATQAIANVSRLARLPPTGDPGLDDEEGRGPYASVFMSYRVAGGHTRYAFAEDRIKNYATSVCCHSVAQGPEFMDGMRNREPVAMFTLMFWGVLMHRQSNDEMIWWVRSSGRELVEETSQIVAASHLSYLEDAREGIQWCREEAGLEPLDFPELDPLGIGGEVLDSKIFSTV